MKYITAIFTISMMIFCQKYVYSRIIIVGASYEYNTLESAAKVALPGDIIIIKNGVYSNRENITSLNGEPGNPIIIHAED